jgi:hypothetical protein
MKYYDTLSQAVNELQKKGYTYNFSVNKDCIECLEHGISLTPDDFEIEEVHRFEGETNPDDQSVLYAVASKDGSIKGLVINAYGVYSDETSAALVQKLSVHHH